jgi:Ca2+-binding EF-hand superfamily protein
MKKVALITTISLSLVIGVAGLLMAGHHYHGCSEMMMSELSSIDTDNDGVINVEEFAEPHMKKFRGWFKMLDTDGDGFLSQEEWDEFRKVHGYGDNFEG